MTRTILISCADIPPCAAVATFGEPATCCPCEFDAAAPGATLAAAATLAGEPLVTERVAPVGWGIPDVLPELRGGAGSVDPAALSTTLGRAVALTEALAAGGGGAGAAAAAAGVVEQLAVAEGGAGPGVVRGVEGGGLVGGVARGGMEVEIGGGAAALKVMPSASSRMD